MPAVTLACTSCGASPECADLISLWDRRDYCADCLWVAAPALLAAATRGDEALREEYAPPVRRLFLLWFRFLAASFASVFALLPLIILIKDPGQIGIGLLAWGGIVALGLPIAALFATGSAFAARTHRPIVSVTAGVVEVRQGRETAQALLSECEWYCGDVSHMNLVPQVAVLHDPAVILVLPDDPKGQPRKVAVGLSVDTRELWTAFLRLSKIPERTDILAGPSRPSFLRLLAPVLFFPLAFLLCGLAGRFIGKLVAFWTADPSAGSVVGVIVLIYGTISAILYAALFLPWQPFRLIPTRRPQLLQRAYFRRIFWGWLLVNTLVFALPFAFSTNRRLDLSRLARGVGIVLSYAWAAAAGFDLGRRISRSDFEYARPVDRGLTEGDADV